MTETAREVPLSLQVFHSHNEYKAHRRNRTEQIYLKDLSAGLGREEKLYAKEYAFQRSSFHRHYARRFSAPLLPAPPAAPFRAATAPTSAMTPTTPRPGTSRRNVRSANSSVFGGNIGRPVSVPSPRASLFSASSGPPHASTSTAPGSSSCTPLAARMLDGLKEMSVSTRFQRIQRKFSIASMTENGCLTPEGDSLANDILEVRKRLFKRGGPGTRKRKSAKDSAVSPSTENNKLDTMTIGVEEGEASFRENACETDGPVLNASGLNVNVPDQKRIGSNAKTPHKKALSDLYKANESESENVQQNFETDPRMKMPSLKLRANINFLKHINSKGQGHVTITEPIPEAADPPADDTLEDLEPEADTSQSELFSHQTSSIFKRFLSNTPYTEPLQMKIKEFLQEQTKFNHRFPKGQENSMDQSERHKELLSGEKEKKERLQKEQEKKKEIVFEVLKKLGITDEHVWFHYNQ